MHVLENIRIVLIGTTHPGNIGATARAMKTMGLQQLYLVQPKYFPHAEANALASGADDILERAIVVETLAQALTGCSLVVGSSARLRSLPIPLLSPRECSQQLLQHAQSANVCLLFGPEHSGLTNQDLAACHYHVHIPTNPEFSSLNVAAAVQVLAYELRMAVEPSSPSGDESIASRELASYQEVELFYQHLEQVLVELDFLKPTNPRKLMLRLRRLFNRAQIDNIEINILRGILTALQKAIPKSQE